MYAKNISLTRRLEISGLRTTQLASTDSHMSLKLNLNIGSILVLQTSFC